MNRHVSGTVLMAIAFAGFVVGGITYFMGYIGGGWGFVVWQFMLFAIVFIGFGLDNLAHVDNKKAEIANLSNSK